MKALPPRGTTLFRGVHAGHPRFDEARQGIVVPGNLVGTVTPAQHNLGGRSAESAYTSWTTSRETALDFRGIGGVLLALTMGALERREDGIVVWRWQESPDKLTEDEVLLEGIRLDAEVVHDEP